MCDKQSREEAQELLDDFEERANRVDDDRDQVESVLIENCEGAYADYQAAADQLATARRVTKQARIRSKVRSGGWH